MHNLCQQYEGKHVGKRKMLNHGSITSLRYDYDNSLSVNKAFFPLFYKIEDINLHTLYQQDEGKTCVKRREKRVIPNKAKRIRQNKKIDKTRSESKANVYHRRNNNVDGAKLPHSPSKKKRSEIIWYNGNPLLND